MITSCRTSIGRPTHRCTSPQASAASPITISTDAGLAAIADGLDKHYKLLNNIDVGTNWTPIGSTSANAFIGSLDGNGKTVTISGLASDSGNVYVGLFGYNAGTIERLSVMGSGVAYDGGNVYIGSIAGWNAGTINQCSSSASVTANATDQAFAGGIAGYSSGSSISNCYTTGSVAATSSSLDAYAGGIVGYLQGALSNCHAAGNVMASGDNSSFAGGIAGVNGGGGSIANCVALNSGISVSGDAYIGRITAHGSMGVLTNNYGSSSMTLGGSGHSWTNVGLDGVSGADVTLVDSEDEDWWKSTSSLGWSWGPIWEVTNGYYPTLK